MMEETSTHAIETLVSSHGCPTNDEATKRVRFKPHDDEALQDLEMEPVELNSPDHSYAAALTGKTATRSTQAKIAEDFEIADEDKITANSILYAHGPENRYFLARFQNDEDYIKVLAEAWIRFLGLPEYMYNKKILSSIGSLVGKVAKLHFHKDTSNRRRFALIAVYVDLTKPLISKLEVGNKIQVVEYENLPSIYFSCGRFGHMKEACPSSSQPHDQQSSEVKTVINAHAFSKQVTNALEEVETAPYGPWMMVEKRHRKKSTGPTKSSEQAIGSKISGSRFTALNADAQSNDIIPEQPGETVVIPAPRSILNLFPRLMLRMADVSMQDGSVDTAMHSPIHNQPSTSRSAEIINLAGSNFHTSTNLIFDNSLGMEGQLVKSSLGLSKRKVVAFIEKASSNILPISTSLHPPVSRRTQSSKDRGASYFRTLTNLVISRPLSMIMLNKGCGGHRFPWILKEYTQEHKPDLMALLEFPRILKEYTQEHKPDLMALLETCISGIKADRSIASFGFENSFRVEAAGFSGGIWMVWNAHLRVEIIAAHPQFVHAKVTSTVSARPLFVSIIYGLCFSRLLAPPNHIHLGRFGSWQGGPNIHNSTNLFRITGSNEGGLCNLYQEKQKLKKYLANIQAMFDHNSSAHLLDKELKVRTKLEDILDHEELLWQQKSRATWVKDRDRNTKYFHSRAMTRPKSNRIQGMKLSSGDWCFEDEVLRNEAILFFSLYWGNRVVQVSSQSEKFLRLSNSDLQCLDAVISNDEIKQELFNMSPLKASGIDGLHALFFQSQWATVGESVCNCINSCSYTQICTFLLVNVC
ncbi:hypothetical protein F3Y22_tig00111166pilonHSYRG00310 [Hibiscus syriacus]|uniref:CCHC-type domain-containing protein n=1 Tax=Hibiscus syriacus TaxID=106335 RepID=A0A6A2YYC6_HIBSY|nr:hypothetical protein F3Y22_tig00111166pilonHSYRG00310 [Hibiscus syriacus]